MTLIEDRQGCSYGFALEDFVMRRPPKKRGAGGEWDWFWQLSAGRRLALYRHMGGPARRDEGPDDLATLMGTDIDTACLAWVRAIEQASTVAARLAHDELADFAEHYATAPDVRADDLVSASDIADRLKVPTNTVTKWFHRRLMPAPVAFVERGTMRLWSWEAVETWAVETGRLADESPRP